MSGPLRSRDVVAGAAGWLVAACAVGGSGILRGLRPPMPQVVLVGLTLALLVAITRWPRLRDWAMTVDARALIGFHLTRFVGVYFLVLCKRGELPQAFAVPAGWGDIAVATLALGLVASNVQATWPLRLWNGLGLLDILLVVATATRQGLADPTSMAEMLHLPLSLLLTWLVPMIIASHLVIAARLGRYRSKR